MLEKALDRNSAAEFIKLGHLKDGQPRIKDAPPLIYHANDLQDPAFEATVRDSLAAYRESLPDERRVLFDR